MKRGQNISDAGSTPATSTNNTTEHQAKRAYRKAVETVNRSIADGRAKVSTVWLRRRGEIRVAWLTLQDTQRVNANKTGKLLQFPVRKAVGVEVAMAA